MDDLATTVLYCKYCNMTFGRKESYEQYLANGTDFTCDLCKQMHVKYSHQTNQPERPTPETLDKEKDDAMGKYYLSNIRLTEM